MAHKKVYGICENKCKVEVSSKKEVESKVTLTEKDGAVVPVNITFVVTGEYTTPATLGLKIVG